ELAVLARVDGEADKGARAVLQGAFRSPSGHLVSRACFGEGYSDGSRPMVKKDDAGVDEIDVAGDKHLVTKHEKVHPYPRKDGDAAFAIEAFCHFKSCHLFNMADALLGR
ncbi:unnamed protein product, partial [Effrenium voratum]